MSQSDLAKIPLLYHFTDRSNLSSIQSNGGIYAWSELNKKGIAVAAPGGNEWSRDADAMKGMDNYVHLCFRNSHPMEYAARADGRIKDSIFLRISAEILNNSGVMFTADVSNKSGVDPVDLKDAAELIDFEVLYTRTNWSDPDIQKRLRSVEKYEILVPRFVPISLVRMSDNG